MRQTITHSNFLSTQLFVVFWEKTFDRVERSIMFSWAYANCSPFFRKSSTCCSARNAGQKSDSMVRSPSRVSVGSISRLNGSSNISRSIEMCLFGLNNFFPLHESSWTWSVAYGDRNPDEAMSLCSHSVGIRWANETQQLSLVIHDKKVTIMRYSQLCQQLLYL